VYFCPRAMQLRHKKCVSVIRDHKWPLTDGIDSLRMDSVVRVKKAKLRRKNAVDVIQIDHCHLEVITQLTFLKCC